MVCANDINNALTIVKYILLLYCLLKTNICIYNKFLNFYHIHPRMYDMIIYLIKMIPKLYKTLYRPRDAV